jgi:hypothetical protein
MQQNKEAFPFLEYDGNNLENSRLDHSGWGGLVLPVDHPFWQEHFSVRAYGCKCRVRGLTRRQLERSGRPLSSTLEVAIATYFNKRAGEVQQIPAGVHPSFHYPPGGRRASLNNHLVDRLDAATPEIARASISDLVGGEAFSQWYSKPSGNFPVAYLSKHAAAQLSAKTRQVLLPDYTLSKQKVNHPEISSREYALVQDVIDHGEVIVGPRTAL